MPAARNGGDRLVFRLDRVRVDDAWIPATGRVVLFVKDTEQVTVDDTLEVVWSYTPVQRMPSGMAAFTRSQDASGTATAWSVQVIAPNHSFRRFLVDARRMIGERIFDAVPGDAGALMNGIVTGDDSALSPGGRVAFLATGTSHVTAVSGTNIAMLLALWEKPVRRRTRRRNLAVQAAIILSIWLYALATGLEPSALRAAAVASLIVLSGRFGRRADPMTVLVVASAGLLLWQPFLTRSVGFWLSVFASAALISAFTGSGSDWRSRARSSVTGLVAVQFATLPVIVLVFGYWPPVGLLANLMLAPLMVVAFPVAFTASAMLFVPVVGRVAAVVPALLCDAALDIVQRLSPVMAPVSLEPMGVTGAVLVAAPCLVVLAMLNEDVHRWWPRWRRRSVTQWRQLLVLLAGFATGGGIAMEIFRMYPG
jgi:competence protein ComEC